MALFEQLQEAQKDAMRAKDKLRLGTIRMALAEIKQRQIDAQLEPTDANILAILTKMAKQRKEAAAQYQAANRPELAETEMAEVAVIDSFLPQALTADELDRLLVQAIAETGASSMQEMAKVMAWLKPQVQGRTDMGALSGLVKAKLS